MLDVNRLREDFPILSKAVYGRPLVYLDNAATTQKPRQVVEAMVDEYYSANANVHRGVHFLSQQATEMHEAAREAVRAFIGAGSPDEIVFTRGTTESINLVAESFGEAFMREGDEVIITAMEHHSNIVPWQMLAARRGIKVRVAPVNDDGTLDLDALCGLMNGRTRLVAVTHVSNVLGTVNPVADVIAAAHSRGIAVLIDGAQAVAHLKVDVSALDADFYVFSGHKIFAPTGIGVLYGKRCWLDGMPPYQGGGEMISHVTFDHTEYNTLPYKFEAGTPDYVGSHALAVALGYVSSVGLDAIAAHEHALTQRAIDRLSAIGGVRIYGAAADRGAVVSFNVGHIHHLDIGTLLDRLGIAVRTGHHCAEPLMHRFGVEGMVRASFAFYNTEAEVDALADGLARVVRMFH